MSDYSSIFVHSHCVSKTQLLSYIQQKLDKEETYVVESHLNDCQFCNDALDALIETDITQVEKHLSDAKIEITQQLFPKIEALTTSISEDSNIRKFEINKKTVSRWLAAASVLLLIGLGGYTVFSFIQSHKKELSLNEKGKNPSAYDAEYSKPANENGEIVRLNVENNDTFRKYAEDDLKRNKNVNEIASTATPGSVEKDHTIFDKLSKNEVKSLEPAYKPPVFAESKADEEKISEFAAKAPQLATDDAKIDPAPGMENYARGNRDEKIQSEVTKEVARKKSTSGMKYDNNVQSNQMNYPRGNNNDFGQQRNVEPVVAQKQEYEDNVQEKEMSNYEKGMDHFNNKNYKKSISFFEKALKKATGAEREDIMYHLALAFEYTGKTEKANELYASLSKSKKYSENAERKLKEAQIEQVQKKK